MHVILSAADGIDDASKPNSFAGQIAVDMLFDRGRQRRSPILG